MPLNGTKLEVLVESQEEISHPGTACLKMRRTLIIGHRGASGFAIENTESSFKAALAAGVDIIETDLRLSADGHLLAAHDADFSRLGGPPKPIAQCKKSELSEIVLRDGANRIEKPLFMEDALNMFPNAYFNVDLKDSGKGIVRAWASLLMKNRAGTRCITASFRDRTIRHFSKICVDAPVSVARFGVAAIVLLSLFGIIRRPKGNERYLQVPEQVGPIRVLTEKRAKKLQKKGWKIHVWTVDNEQDMCRLIGWGIDGIMTNRPLVLRKLLESRNGKGDS